MTPRPSPRRSPTRNIFVWSGYYYAWEPATVLGLREGPGAVRIGLSHYNSAAEVDGLLGRARRHHRLTQRP